MSEEDNPERKEVFRHLDLIENSGEILVSNKEREYLMGFEEDDQSSKIEKRINGNEDIEHPKSLQRKLRNILLDIYLLSEESFLDPETWKNGYTELLSLDGPTEQFTGDSPGGKYDNIYQYLLASDGPKQNIKMGMELGTAMRSLHENCYEDSSSKEGLFHESSPELGYTRGTNEQAIITGFISAFLHDRSPEYRRVLIEGVRGEIDYLEQFEDYEREEPTEEDIAKIKEHLRNLDVTPSDTLVHIVYTLSSGGPIRFKRTADDIVKRQENQIRSVEELFEIAERNAQHIESESIGLPGASAKKVLKAVYQLDGGKVKDVRKEGSLSKNNTKGTLNKLSGLNLVEVSGNKCDITWLGNLVGKYLFEDMTVDDLHQIVVDSPDSKDVRSLFIGVENNRGSGEDKRTKNILKGLDRDEVSEILKEIESESEFPVYQDGLYENQDYIEDFFTLTGVRQLVIEVMVRKAEELNTLD
jgi:hypothetical protein